VSSIHPENRNGSPGLGSRLTKYAGTSGQMAWAQQSKLRYFTLAGSEVMRVFRDFPAQIVQHTIDHLHRSLWIDRP